MNEVDEECGAQGWGALDAYRDQMDDAWHWGYCAAALRELALRAGTTAAVPHQDDVARLLVAWQIVHGFPLEYPLPISA